MKRITRYMFLLAILAIPLSQSAQVITNVNTSTQNCQNDTITVTFSVSSPLNAGNQFKVQLSDASGNFSPGTDIELSPLLGYNVGAYSMDAAFPIGLAQGGYKIRVVGSNPVVASDTVDNVLVGARPNTNITIYNTYTFNNEQRFCFGDTAVLVGPPPPPGETHGYQWFKGGAPLTGAIDDSLVITESGVYSLEVTLGLCNAISPDTIVNVYTPPSDITVDPDSSINEFAPFKIRMCEGTTAILRGPQPVQPGIEFKYQWLTDSVDPLGFPHYKVLPNDTMSALAIDSVGVFYLAVTEVNGGCSDTSADGWLVYVDTIPQTSILNAPWPGQNIPSLTLCKEDSTLLTVQDTIFWPMWQYQWQVSYPPGSAWLDLPNDTMFTLKVDTTIIADTAEYRLVINNQSCTFETNSLIVNFVDDPVYQIYPSDSVATCAGDSVLVQLLGNALNYIWSDGYVGANRWLKQAGVYPVEGIGVNQCSTWDTVKVGIYTVVANAGPNQTIVPGQNVQLNGSGGVSYYWYADKPVYFNNQLIANPTSKPTADTTLYFVDVTGPNGCKATDSVWVYVVDTAGSNIYANIQNVITPNGDGKNDMLDIATIIDGDECEMIIINRWGENVFSEFPYNNTWEGTSNGGDDLPDGTYYYIVKYQDTIRYKGAVTILRNSK